jgi:hypothetical protein
MIARICKVPVLGRYICLLSANEMCSIVLLNYSFEEGCIHKIWNTLLSNIANMGFRLKTRVLNVGFEEDEEAILTKNHCGISNWLLCIY